MTKKTNRNRISMPSYPKALDDPINISFMDLIEKDKAKVVGTVAVDSGQIELGDSGKIQIKLDTATGDGFYPVWQGKKYVVIEMDMLNIMRLDRELKEFEEDNS